MKHIILLLLIGLYTKESLGNNDEYTCTSESSEPIPAEDGWIGVTLSRNQNCTWIVNACAEDEYSIVEFAIAKDELVLDSLSVISIGDESGLLHEISGGLDKDNLRFITSHCLGWLNLQTFNNIMDDNYYFNITYVIHPYQQISKILTDSGCVSTSEESNCEVIGGLDEDYPLNTIANITVSMEAGHYMEINLFYLQLDRNAQDMLIIYSDSGNALSGTYNNSQGFLTAGSDAQVIFISNNHNLTLDGFKLDIIKLGNATSNITTTTEVNSVDTDYIFTALLNVPTSAMNNQEEFSIIDEDYREGVAISVTSFADDNNITLTREPRSSDIETIPLYCDVQCDKDIVSRCIREQTGVYLAAYPDGYMLSHNQLQQLLNNYLHLIQEQIDQHGVTVSLEVNCDNTEWWVGFLIILLVFVVLLVAGWIIISRELKLRQLKDIKQQYEENLADESLSKEDNESPKDSFSYYHDDDDEKDVPFRGIFDPDAAIIVPSDKLKTDLFTYSPFGTAIEEPEGLRPRKYSTDTEYSGAEAYFKVILEREDEGQPTETHL